MRRGASLLGCVMMAIGACGAPPEGNPDEARAPLIETAELRSAEPARKDQTAAAMQAMVEDFAVLKLAARTQAAFHLYDDGAEVHLRAIGPDGQIALDERFTLAADVAGDSPALNAHRKAGYAIRTFTLRPQDEPRMRRLRGTLAELKARAPGQNQLGIDAFVPGCLAEPDAAPDTLNLTVYLKIRPDQDWFALTREQALSAGDTPLAEQFWTPCEADGS